MILAQLRDYLPSILRGVLADKNTEAAALTDEAEELLYRAGFKATDDYARHTRWTSDNSVLGAYLRALGIELPNDKPSLIRRAYLAHRAYLKYRGTRKGLRILSWIVTGEIPAIESGVAGMQRADFGQKLSERSKHRLFSHLAAQRSVTLSFKRKISSETSAQLSLALRRDVPAGGIVRC